MRYTIAYSWEGHKIANITHPRLTYKNFSYFLRAHALPSRPIARRLYELV